LGEKGSKGQRRSPARTRVLIKRKAPRISRRPRNSTKAGGQQGKGRSAEGEVETLARIQPSASGGEPRAMSPNLLMGVGG